MEGRAEAETLRTLRGPAAGEVSVHLVPRGSPGPGPHLPTAAFIIPASSATLGLPSRPLEVSCLPREPIRVGAPQRVPVTATVLPQSSAGPAASSGAGAARLPGWSEAQAPAPPPGGGLRSRRREHAPRTMVGAEHPRSPELRREAVAEYEARQAPAKGGRAGTQQPGRSPGRSGTQRRRSRGSGRGRVPAADLPQDPPGDPPQDPPENGATCQCRACEPQPGARPDAGASKEGCPPRAVIVENSSGPKPYTSTSELLKPVKKRKYREYHSPSEESEPDALEKREERKDPEGQPAASVPESEAWSGGQPAPGARKEGWSWESYLEEQKATTAPASLFQDHQTVPPNKNGFRSGMKLEGIDPQHPSMYFVFTVAEVCGYRLRLHFDGYSECHDFWINANNPDIHPAGWFEKTGHRLQPPNGYQEEEFSWSQYLRSTRAQAAPKHLFASQTRRSLPLGFQVGRKLEAVDRMNPSLVCVASVSDVVGPRFLVHFDNWDDTYDYWCDATSPYIHPVGWCQKHGKPLTPPQDYPDPDSFCWEKYLEETGASAVPSWAFKMRPPHGFLVNMKLEAVDRRSPSLIRVASVEDVEDYRIKLHFDGWSHAFDFWIDADHPDIHPAGWCSHTGHPLQPPLPPPDPRELGSASPESCLPLSYWGLPHARTSKYSFHHRKCPTPGCDGSGHITALTPDVIHQSFLLPALPAPPDRYLSACWQQHCKLLPGVAGISASAVAKWTIDEVFGFVQTLTGCEDQARLFKDEADIVKIMSVKLGPALKIYNAILMFKNTDDTLK